MLVISDTSPICYLVLIEHIDLLPHLYNRVVVPQSVYEELGVAGSSEAVRSWIANRPNWLEVQAIAILPNIIVVAGLDRRECEAIALAEQLQADVVLLDEKRARRVAVERGLDVVGLLGILGSAADQGLIDFADAIERLQNTNFWASPTLIQSLLNRYQTDE